MLRYMLWNSRCMTVLCVCCWYALEMLHVLWLTHASLDMLCNAMHKSCGCWAAAIVLCPPNHLLRICCSRPRQCTKIPLNRKLRICCGCAMDFAPWTRRDDGTDATIRTINMLSICSQYAFHIIWDYHAADVLWNAINEMRTCYPCGMTPLSCAENIKLIWHRWAILIINCVLLMLSICY